MWYHPQMGEVQYEERLYPAGHWASVTRGDDLYEQSISMAFMKLMRFICKENSAGQATPTTRQPHRTLAGPFSCDRCLQVT